MQDFLLFGVSGYQPAWSGGQGHLSFEGWRGVQRQGLECLCPQPLCCPCSHPSTSPLECLQRDVGQDLGKGEVEGRKKISWVWSDGDWDKAGVFSLRLGLYPWAASRAQGLGWAEQQEEK